MTLNISLRIVLVLSISLLCNSIGKASELLTIGSPAPPLDIEHWIHDGQGKFKPVTKFETKKVYVVEFWATWCGPCISSMPHLASLQKHYADRVQLVSVSDESLETVERFLARPVRGAAPPTDETASQQPQSYRQLTSAYCLTTDPDQSTYTDYMQAAAQDGIPTAFIVGKDGRIEWIGHPMDLDEPLEAVVDDRWDRAAFGTEFRKQQEAERLMREMYAKLNQQDFDGALQVLDKALANNQGDMQMQGLKLQILVAAQKMAPANQHLQQMYRMSDKDPATVNTIAWNIYEMAMSEKLPPNKLVGTSIDAGELAIQQASGALKASLMDTVAHLLSLTGNIEQALKLETAALKIADPDEVDFMRQFIDELKSMQKKKQAPSKSQ